MVYEKCGKSIHHAGSGQMGIMRRLMESVDYQNGHPAEELLLSGQKERYERIAVFAGADYVFAYDYLGGEFTLDLKSYLERNFQHGGLIRQMECIAIWEITRKRAGMRQAD